MPLQNRVTPLGEVIATPERGLVYANRGCIHDPSGRIRERRYPTKRWIACQLEFRGRHRRPLMAPGKFTELFFLDEATALAAGHRPCGECRYADYTHLTAMWADLHPGQLGADAIDEQLDRERRDPGTKRRRFHQVPYDDLPTARSCWSAAHPTSCSTQRCSAGRRPATRRAPTARRGQVPPRP